MSWKKSDSGFQFHYNIIYNDIHLVPLFKFDSLIEYS